MKLCQEHLDFINSVIQEPGEGIETLYTRHETEWKKTLTLSNINTISGLVSVSTGLSTSASALVLSLIVHALHKNNFTIEQIYLITMPADHRDKVLHTLSIRLLHELTK